MFKDKIKTKDPSDFFMERMLNYLRESIISNLGVVLQAKAEGLDPRKMQDRFLDALDAISIDAGDSDANDTINKCLVNVRTLLV